MSKLDFFSRFSRHFERKSKNIFKKIAAKKIFLLFFKKVLFLSLDSWATFAEAHKLKKLNEIASFAMFLLMKCTKFQCITRMSKSAAVCGFYLLVVRVILEPQRRIVLKSAVFVCISS